MADEILKLMKEGWIAGYPPWFFKFATKLVPCKDEAQLSRLVHLLRAIEDGKVADTQRLLPEFAPNLRLVMGENETWSLLEWAAHYTRNPEIIRLLIKAGADVKAPRLIGNLIMMCNHDALAEALKAGADPSSCPGGESVLAGACWTDPKAVRLLLDAGARTDTTTRVYITNKKRVDRVTPLMCAAYAGQPQIAKMLLDAGADPNAVDSKGNTALAWANISRAKAKAAKIIELLQRAGAQTEPSGSGLPESVDFSARAKTPEFKQALALAKALTKSAAKPIENDDGSLPGVKAFRIRDAAKAIALLDDIRPQLAQHGAWAILCDTLFEAGVPYLVVLPTTDYREAIIAFETPVGQSIDSYELIAWLAKLEQTQPFILTHIAPDRIQGRFTTPIKNPLQLVKSIGKICPEVLDSPKEVAAHLEKSRDLFLWWD